MSKFLFAIAVSLLMSCTKDKSQGPLSENLDGMYIGDIHYRFIISIGPNSNLDTLTYSDTIIVELQSDSIRFIKDGNKFSFKIDTSEYYNVDHGIHTFEAFEFLENDTLRYSYYFYSGDGFNFSSTSYDFKGKKH